MVHILDHKQVVVDHNLNLAVVVLHNQVTASAVACADSASSVTADWEVLLTHLTCKLVVVLHLNTAVVLVGILAIMQVVLLLLSG